MEVLKGALHFSVGEPIELGDEGANELDPIASAQRSDPGFEFVDDGGHDHLQRGPDHCSVTRLSAPRPSLARRSRSGVMVCLVATRLLASSQRPGHRVDVQVVVIDPGRIVPREADRILEVTFRCLDTAPHRLADPTGRVGRGRLSPPGSSVSIPFRGLRPDPRSAIGRAAVEGDPPVPGIERTWSCEHERLTRGVVGGVS